MYCKKCGKELDQEAELCEECKAKEAEAPVAETPAQPVAPAPAADYNPRMEGFKPALTGAIFATVAVIVAAIASALLYSGWFGAIIGILFLAAAVVLAVPALILGIRSIKVFVNQKNAGQPVPIATLILGIATCCEVVGIAVTVLTSFFGWIFWLI